MRKKPQPLPPPAAPAPPPPPRPRVNVYRCPAGHETITVDRDEGTTPFLIVCNQGGHACTETARSSFYRVDPTLTPSHEWYKPTMPMARMLDVRVPGTLEHVRRGGLLLRPLRAS